MRRSLGAVLWSMVGLLSCFLGGLSALLGTGAGRTLLTRSLAGTLERAVAGRVEVGDIGGTLFTGVTLRDVRLFDADSTLVAWLPLADIAYNPFDFAAGRVVLQEVRLERPQFNFVQHPNGRLNLEELLRLGVKRDSGPRGPAPLVLLRNVQITNGSLVLRLRDAASAGDSTLEIDEFGPDGRRRVRRFDDLNLRLTALRLSAPRERGIRVDIESLAALISDPPVTVRDAAGTVSVVGDSLELDVRRLRLPASQLALTGRLTWPRDTILYDLDVVTDSATLGDFTWIDPRFPAAARLRGALAIRSSRGGLLTVRLDPVQIRHHGGTLRGKVTAVSLADSGLIRVRDGDLAADNVDLELARPFLDTLPFAGRLSGQTVVSGPIDSLALSVQWSFRDSLVPGWPETRLAGAGIVDLTDPEGIAFHPFVLDSATVALGTARRLVPALELRGTVYGVGALQGPYTNATFDGTLRHRDGALPVSQVRGRLRLDARRDTLGVSADLIADTLALAGLRGSYPDLPLGVALTGPIRMDGTVADLETHAALAALGARGTVRVDGRLILLAPPLGARALRVETAELDLRSWLGGDAPGTSLTFTLDGDIVAADASPPVGAVRASLSSSTLERATMDSGTAVIRFADGRMLVDTLSLRLRGVWATAQGELGWEAPADGRLSVQVHADSLEALDPIATWLAGSVRAEDDTSGPLQGVAELRATVTGSLDALTVEAQTSVQRLRWREWAVPGGRAVARFEPALGRFAVATDLDSIAHGDLGFGSAAARVAGAADSLSWFARSRVGDWLAFLAGGSLRRGAAATTVRIDSAAVLLPGEIWLLDEPARVGITDTAIRIDAGGLDLRRGRDSIGRLSLAGGFPLRGAGEAKLEVRDFPLAAVLALAINDTTGARARIDADFTMGGSRRDPEIQGAFLVVGGTPVNGEPLIGQGSLTYRARRLDAMVRALRGNRRILDATAHLPLDLALAPVARRQLPDTLSVRVVADSLDLSQLGVLEAVALSLRGRLVADVGIRGTWETPALTGHAAVSDAGVTFQGLNVRYEDVNGRLVFVGDTIRVDTLRLRSGDGRLALTGFVELEGLTRPRLALELAAQEFRALEIRNYMSVTASGQLALRGPLIGATLTGQGTVTSGVLYFQDLVNKRVVNLDEPWVATLIAPDELRQDLGAGLHYRILDSLRVRNLTLRMGSDVWLRSTEANIQLSGSVNVSKEGRNYLLSGTLEAPRGTYRLVVGPVTREFVVTGGNVRYFGTPDLNAELDISAQHTVRLSTESGRSELTVGSKPEFVVAAHIGGTLLVPRLTLSVEGENLSQTEIISYLIFGRSSFELAGEGGPLGDYQNVLKSIVATNLSGELERTLVSDLGVPLDYIEIDFQPGASSPLFSGALLAAGWQIGQRTFLKLNAGFCQGRQTDLSNILGATLQYRLSREWRSEISFEPVRGCGPVELERASAVPRQFGLDLFWERRY